MGFKENVHDNIEERKETAEKRKPLLDNIAKNRPLPKNPVKSPASTTAGAPIKTPRPPLNTPARATTDTGGKKSIGPRAGVHHFSPVTEEPGDSSNLNVVNKGKQKLIEEAFAEIHITPDTPTDENKKESIKIARNSISGHPNDQKPNIQNITSPFYLHPEMVLFKTDPYDQSQLVATKFNIQGNQVIEVPDPVGQKFWDSSIPMHSGLPTPTKSKWAMERMCSLEEETSTNPLYGDETHCLVEFQDLGVRYSFRFYKGICMWYVRFLDNELNLDPVNKWSKFPPGRSPPQEKLSHPFYKNRLIPRTHWDFASCEALAKRNWGLQHKECHHSHFRVNIYVNAKQSEISYTNNVDLASLLDPHARFTSHRVCGHALVADLFRAMVGGVGGVECREPEDWQCLREVLFCRRDETPNGMSVELGKSYVYGTLKTQGRVKTMMVDTTWFRLGRDYVWLLPTKTNFLGKDDLGFETWFNPEGKNS